MPVAANPVVVYIKASSAAPVAGDEVDGINNYSFGPKMDLLETTDFKDTTGAKTKIAGLLDGTISLSGMAEMSDAPQNLLRSSWLSGASVWCTIHWNPSGGAGTKGYQVECKVESWESSGEVAGLANFSVSLSFTGAPVAV